MGRPKSWRAIDRRLRIDAKFDVDDMKSVLNDITSPFGEEYAQFLLKIVRKVFQMKDEIFEMLKGWNGVESIDSDASSLPCSISSVSSKSISR